MAALAAVVFPALAPAASETVTLMPEVTYTREVRWARGGPLVVHSMTAPKPGGLYALKPVLSNGRIAGLERVSAMQRRLSRTATVAGVNGDLFNVSTGHPSGIFMQDGTLLARPWSGRSTLGIGLDGLLRVRLISFFGSWQANGGAKRPLHQFNRPLEGNAVGLFTPAWGAATPRTPGAVDVVLTGFPRTTPHADLTAAVAGVRRGGGTRIPAGGAVVQAQGFWADRLAAEVRGATSLTVRLMLKPWWQDVADAIGGGPAIVRNGRLVSPAAEQFTRNQLHVRHPRTGVGQLADGRILLVAIDGRRKWSTGVRPWELGLEMIRLGAVTAMALDAGGSTTIAFDGQVLNSPSDGAERAVGDALMVLYYGAYAPFPRFPVVSPNGDGVADRQRLSYKVVRPSQVDVALVGPDGNAVWRDQRARRPGTLSLTVDPSKIALTEGQWRWVVRAVDDEGRKSGIERTFAVNNTLGFLRLSAKRIRVVPKKGGRLVVSFKLANPANVAVTVENAAGRVVRSLYRRKGEQPSTFVVRWDGRAKGGRVVPTGAYTVRVAARNGLGAVELERAVSVKTTKPPRKKKRR